MNVAKLLFKGATIREILLSVRNGFAKSWRLYLACATYTVVFSVVTILRYQTFLASGFDLGIYNQAFWTTLSEQRLFYETGDLSFNPNGSFFGVHFSPILFLLLPIYAVHPGPEVLLVMQSAILALGAIPVYWLARERFNENASLAISLIYLLYPPLHYLNLNDFHVQAFTSTFLLFTVYYLVTEKWRKFLLFAALTMSSIEFAPILVTFVAVYGFIRYFTGKFRTGVTARNYLLFTLLVSVLYFFLAVKMKEFFNPYTSPVPSIFHDILRDPIGAPNNVLVDGPAKVLYLIYFLAPLAFLPLLAPGPLVMILPWLATSFISTYPLYYSIYFHYTGFVIPFIFVSLPKAIDRLSSLFNRPGRNRRIGRLRRILVTIFLATALLAVYIPAAPGTPWHYQAPIPDDRTDLIHKFINLVPSNASILTQNNLFPHVSSRTDAYMYLQVQSDTVVDYILVDTTSIWYNWEPIILGTRIPLSLAVREALETGRYGVLAAADGLLLLKRDYVGEPEIFIPHVSQHNQNDLAIRNGVISEEPTSSTGVVLLHRAGDPSGVFWHGPYISLLPGLYRVKYRIMVDSSWEIKGKDHILTVDATADAGNTLLAKKYVYGLHVSTPGEWFEVTLFFGLRIPSLHVEFRGFAVGDQNVRLDYILVEQLSANPSDVIELSFNQVDLFVDHGIVSEGVITHTGGRGNLWFGPYTSLPKGNYTTRFWLMLDEPWNGDLLDIDIFSLDLVVLASQTIRDSDFVTIGEWQSFELMFTLSDDTDNLEFRGVYAREGAPVSFLLVELCLNLLGEVD